MHFFIVEHGGRLPANRLWNDLSIRAAALEVGARVWNLTFLEHTRSGWWLHWLLARVIDRLTHTHALWARGAPAYLPPTGDEYIPHRLTLFFFGWMFRNPAGMEKYRKELLALFDPIVPFAGKVHIGIHNRREPFPGFPGGEYLIGHERVQAIKQEYLAFAGVRAQDAVFVVSDDVFELARCSVVLGDNSTASNLAAWLGNVAHVVMAQGLIDWEYYRGKNRYFENKYATFALGALTAETIDK